jgi:hypothetical protein
MAFLYTNNQQAEKEIRIIPFTIVLKNKPLKYKHDGYERPLE